MTQDTPSAENHLTEVEHDLAVATGEGWTDKLVFMATNDIPWLIKLARSLQERNALLEEEKREMWESLTSIEARYFIAREAGLVSESTADMSNEARRCMASITPPSES